MKSDGSSIIVRIGCPGVDRCCDFVRNAGRGTGFGEANKLESLAARMGVKSPKEASRDAVFLARLFFGVENLPAEGDGASASARISLSIVV